MLLRYILIDKAAVYSNGSDRVIFINNKPQCTEHSFYNNYLIDNTHKISAHKPAFSRYYSCHCYGTQVDKQNLRLGAQWRAVRICSTMQRLCAPKFKMRVEDV